jgi:hypothetical protein
MPRLVFACQLDAASVSLGSRLIVLSREAMVRSEEGFQDLFIERTLVLPGYRQLTGYPGTSVPYG